MNPIPPAIERQIVEAHARLLGEFQAAWNDLDNLLGASAAGELPSAGGSLDETAGAWLVGPLQGCRSTRPLERVLEAIEDHRRRCREVVRELPSAAESPPVDPARELVADGLRGLEFRQGARYGELVALMNQAALELLTPWQLLRRSALRASAGIAGGQDPHRAHAACKARIQDLRRRIGALLESLGEPPPLKLPRRPTPASQVRKQESRLDERLSWWRRQVQAAAGALALEEVLWEGWREIRRLTEAAIERLHEERRGLLAELEALTAWLEQTSGPTPARHTSLWRAEEGVGRWLQEVEAAVRRLVPGQIETAVRWRALPTRRAPWRLVRPQHEILRALTDTAWPLLLAAFREAETAHRGVLQDMERARQVIAFSRELAEREGESGRAAGQEAMTNALLLLRHRRASLGEIRPLLESSADRATAAAWHKLHLKLDRDRFGLWGYLAREGIRQALAAGRERVASAIKKAAPVIQTAWRRSRRHLLARIGWEQPSARRLVHVERREVLSESLGVDLAPRGLPLIYQRLFRPDPVDDPRFLIGREAEMAAMEELRRLWEARRPAGALLVGERGSGKTSLLNCALARIFPDVEVVRTQFQERIWTADQMRRFLEQAGLPGERRAVVVLEELERAWLRRVGGYQALRELLGRVAATSRRLLWIVALNHTAFRLLNAVLGLEGYFSHRINAAAVEQRYLQEAILMRHNLAGLRLHFLAPQGAGRKGAGLRRRLGLELTPEQMFFEALYRESEGLFRSAFELWLKHIERSQDGVLYVQPVERPDYETLLADLNLHDLLTLQALLQHGSLTPEEHSQVFEWDPRASLDRLEVLEDRELIEPDPGRAGFRVRPEAGRAVRLALHRRNLL